MTNKTIEQLLEEQNHLIAKQNELIRATIANTHMEEIKERARRNTPWGCKPPIWAR